MIVTNFRLLDASYKVVDDVSSVHYFESVHADKSLWCRLNLSFRQLMSFILIVSAGEQVVAVVLNRVTYGI